MTFEFSVRPMINGNQSVHTECVVQLGLNLKITDQKNKLLHLQISKALNVADKNRSVRN